jgi:hypothetical protein
MASPQPDPAVLQSIDVMVADVIRQRDELLKALKALTNEASGFLSMADKSTHGVTNMEVLRHWISNAKYVIAAAEEK